jgi:hypothetical protein
MKKVTQAQFWKALTLLTVGCNVVGAMLNIYTKDYWTALTFASAAIIFTIVYLSQLEEGEDNPNDEQ